MSGQISDVGAPGERWPKHNKHEEMWRQEFTVSTLLLLLIIADTGLFAYNIEYINGDLSC